MAAIIVRGGAKVHVLNAAQLHQSMGFVLSVIIWMPECIAHRGEPIVLKVYLLYYAALLQITAYMYYSQQMPHYAH